MNKRNAILFVIITFIMMLRVSLVYAQKSPDEFFGVTIGADKTLVKYPEIIRYFQYLTAQSSRVQLQEEGKSTLGNMMVTAFISSEENIRNLPELLEINKKLASPDTLKTEEVPLLLKKARVFVLITCAIHASEIASTQFAMLLAHEYATTQDTALKEYLDNVVILLMPSINPDGNIMETEWYKKYLGTEYELCRRPYLYHFYAGHDNNRDFYMLNLNETRVVNKVLHHRYFPHIFLDMHQMNMDGPRMFVPPFKDPLNNNLNPLMLRETDIIGSFMALKLQEQGKKGVANSYAFDAYWPGGSKNTAWYKNVVGVLTEMASAALASPVYVEANELQTNEKGLPEYKAQVNFPDPWPGGWWRLKDIIEYEHIAVNALIEVAAKNRDSFLKNYIELGLSEVEKGQKEAPYGYLVPQEQWDTPTMMTFLQKMAENGVRISQLGEETRVGNGVYAKGDYVIAMNQPYRGFIKVMMELQRYPEIKYMKNGPVIEPYDATGWTLPLQMGVKTLAINTPLSGMNLVPVNDFSYPEYALLGEGNYYLLPARFNRSVIVVNRLFKKGVRVFRYTGITENDTNNTIATGDFLVKVADIAPTQWANVLKGTGVTKTRVNVSAGEMKYLNAFHLPRIAIYQSFTAGLDEGWTRWVLDHFEFPFTIINNADFMDKQFVKKYDVVLFPDMNRDMIVKGFSNNRRINIPEKIPPEFRGGIEEKGVAVLKQLVGQGGTVLLLDSASELGIKDFTLPLSNVLEGVKPETFFCPGAILRIEVDNLDPLGWGLERENILYFSESPAYRTRLPEFKAINRKVVAGFTTEGPHLLSGYLKGGELLNHTIMIARFNYYKGNVILLGGRVQFRSQTFATFKFLFNALYYAGLE